MRTSSGSATEILHAVRIEEPLSGHRHLAPLIPAVLVKKRCGHQNRVDYGYRNIGGISAIAGGEIDPDVLDKATEAAPD
jgi:hypothetical protein